MLRLKYGNTNTYFLQGTCGSILIDTDYAGTMPAFYKELKKNNMTIADILDNGECFVGDLEPIEYLRAYEKNQDSHIRIQKEGKVVKAGKSDDRYQKGTQSGLSVAGAFDHSRGEKVHQDLDTEIYSDQQADLIQGNAKLSVKGQKQQRRQIIYNGLGHIAQVTAVDGMFCL